MASIGKIIVPVKVRTFSPAAFMLVAQKFNPYRQPQKPTDGDKKKKKKKGAQ